MILYGHGQRLFVISRPKLGVIPHVGLLLPDDTVVHCTPERGVHRSTVDDFAGGQDVRTLWEVPADLSWTVMQRVSWMLQNPRQYDLITFNCHHLVNELTARAQTATQPFHAR
jgi:hypothetical protein